MPIKDDQYPPIPSPEQEAKIQSLGHRVQSAVAFLESRPERYAEIEPKHLRVGVNSAIIETSALARLLMQKQVFTADEFFEMSIKVWEEEVASYNRRLAQIDPRLSV